MTSWNLKNGFTVSESEDELLIQKNKLSPWLMLFPLALMLFYLVQGGIIALSALQNGRSNSDMVTDIVIAFALLTGGLVGIYRLTDRETLCVTKFDVTQSHFHLGRKTASFILERSKVISVLYGVVATTKYGSTAGLLFESPAITIRSIAGLIPSEVPKILMALERLEYPVHHDPAAPMLQDIEKRGWFVNPWAKG